MGSRAAARVQVAVDDGVLDYYLLLGSPADVLAGNTALTGRPVPPAWSFGWWQSRCSYASAEEVLRVVEEMRDAGVPMDVVHGAVVPRAARVAAVACLRPGAQASLPTPAELDTLPQPARP